MPFAYGARAALPNLSNMKFILAILSLSVGVLSHAQKKNKIHFIFPDSVEITINNYIEEKQERASKEKYSCFLWHDSSSIYRLTILPYKKNEKSVIANWIRSSSRVAVINKRRFPLLLDYDFSFGTSDPENIGQYGERDGYVKKMNLIAHAFTITFDNSKGKIISIEER